MSKNNNREWIKALVKVRYISKSGSKQEKLYTVWEQADMFKIDVEESNEDEKYKSQIRLFSQSIITLVVNKAKFYNWEKFSIQDITYERINLNDDDVDIRVDPFDRRELDIVAAEVASEKLNNATDEK